MCSTFKLGLVGAVLERVDQGQVRLDQPLRYGPGDLLDHAPVCRARLGEGALSVGELCAAAIMVSDNTAANLLLRMLGGPPGFNTAMLKFDMARFYEKSVLDLADSVRPNGGFTETSPFVGIADAGLGGGA